MFPKLTVLFALVFGATVLLAGKPQRHIEETLPRVAQQGTSVEVTIRGLGLANPKEAIFYRGGIQAVEFTDVKPTKQVTNLAHGVQIAEEITCKFVVAPDCPVGEHPFRLRTATQLTTVGTFWVTPFEVQYEVEEQHPNGGQRHGQNDSVDKAELVEKSPVTVYGRIDRGDPDCYKVSRKKGERISVEIDSVRLTDLAYGMGEFDLRVRIYDTAGKVLAENDDSSLHRQDPMLSILAPEDGEYVVEVSQSVYTPRGRVYYLAHLGRYPRPQMIFPLGGQPGKSLPIAVLGDSEHPSQWSSIQLPKSGEFFDWYPKDGKEQAPSAMTVRVLDVPNRVETSKPISLPVALNGTISKTRETDKWKLVAKKGEKYRVQVFARGLGSALDAKVSIRPVGAEEPTVSGDQVRPADSPYYSMATQIRRKALLDPILLWSPDKDGEHLLDITDVRGMGSPHSVYRVEVTPVRDAIHTYLSPKVIDRMQCPRLTAPTIPQGGRWTMSFSLKKGLGNQYAGDIQLEAIGLPKGVKMWSPTFPASVSQIPVHFTAEANVAPQSTLFKVQAKAVDADVNLESRCQESFPFLSRSGGRARHPVSVDEYVLAVTEPAPFSFHVEPPTIPLIRNGELALKVRVDRAEGFDDPIEFKSEWLPSGVSSAPAKVIEAGQSEAFFNLSASSRAALTKSKISLVATTLEYESRGAYTGVGRTRVASKFFEIEVVDPHLQLSSSPTAIRRGETTKFVWRVKHLRDFNGQAEAVLLGLPKGVEMAKPAVLKSGDAELVFDLSANQEALLGNYRELACEVSVPEGDQMVRQRIGKGILRVDPALN